MAGRTLIPDPDDYPLTPEERARALVMALKEGRDTPQPGLKFQALSPSSGRPVSTDQQDAELREAQHQAALRRSGETAIANTEGGIDPFPQPPMMAGDSGGGTTMGRAGSMLTKALLAANGGGQAAPAGDWDALPDAPAATSPAAHADDWDSLPDAPTTAPTPHEAPGALSTFIRYAGHVPGVDQVAGAIGALENQDALHRAMPYLIPFSKDARDAFGHDYRFIRDASREDREAGGDAHSVAKWGGIGAQTALSLGLPSGAAAGAGEAANAAQKVGLGARLLKAAKVGGAIGAAGGALDGDADLTKGEFSKAAEQTGAGALVGAGLGAGLQGGGEAVSWAAQKAAPVLKRWSDMMTARAVGFKKRDIDLATLGSGMSPGDRLAQIGERINGEGGLPTFGTAEDNAARLQQMRQGAGAENGAVLDELDAARPVAPKRQNTLGIDVPAADTVTAGRDVPLSQPASNRYGFQLHASDSTTAMPDVKTGPKRLSAAASPFGIDPNLAAQQPERITENLVREKPTSTLYEGEPSTLDLLSFTNPKDGQVYDAHVVHDPATQSVHIARVQPRGAQSLDEAHAEVANSVGPRELRSLAGELAETYPNAERITGVRTTGANAGHSVDVPMPNPNPPRTGIVPGGGPEVVIPPRAPRPQNVGEIPGGSEGVRSGPDPKAAPTMLSRKAIARSLEARADAMAGNTGERGIADVLRKEAEAIRSGPNERLTFREAEALKRGYGKVYNTLGQNDSNLARKMVYETVKNHVEQEAQTVSPELAAKFQEAKAKFRDLKPAETASVGAEKRDLANTLQGITKVGVPLVAMERLAMGQPLQAAGAVAAPLLYKALESRAPNVAAATTRGLAKSLARIRLTDSRLALPAAKVAEEAMPTLDALLPSFAQPAMADDGDPRLKGMLAALRRR